MVASMELAANAANLVGAPRIGEERSECLGQRVRVVARCDDPDVEALDDGRGLRPWRDDDRPAGRRGVEQLDWQGHILIVAGRQRHRVNGRLAQRLAELLVRLRADQDPMRGVDRGPEVVVVSDCGAAGRGVRQR